MFDHVRRRGRMELEEVERGADETLEACRNMISFGPEGWVPIEGP